MRQRPALERRHLLGITWTGLGLAVGYPFFVALAVEHAATAILSVVRTGERPPPRFWAAYAIGVAAVAVFAVWHGGALGWAALLLGEQVSWPFFATAIVVLASMAVCVRSRIRETVPAASTTLRADE